MGAIRELVTCPLLPVSSPLPCACLGFFLFPCSPHPHPFSPPFIQQTRSEQPLALGLGCVQLEYFEESVFLLQGAPGLAIS